MPHYVPVVPLEKPNEGIYRGREIFELKVFLYFQRQRGKFDSGFVIFQQPFGINALVGLIALSGILMRNTLILIGQIHHNAQEGLDPFHAVVEATVQRARPVLLTALAAILAFIPLTHSVFWGTLAYTLIGGTFVGTIMTLVFLPAMYAIWFKIRPDNTGQTETANKQASLVDRTPPRPLAAHLTTKL